MLQFSGAKKIFFVWQVILNDFREKIEQHSTELVSLLLQKDELETEQDSMLIDVEDISHSFYNWIILKWKWNDWNMQYINNMFESSTSLHIYIYLFISIQFSLSIAIPKCSRIEIESTLQYTKLALNI